MNGVKVFGLMTLSIPLLAIVTHRYYYSKDKQMKKKKKKSEQQVITNVPWSELAPELLGEIVSRLCLTDQVRFLLVCKNWLAAAVTTKSLSSSSSPWLGRIIPGSPEFQIFDPLPPHIRYSATFSTLPDSPDCVYCLIDAYCTDKISVITYRNGDKEWTARQFDKVPGFLSCTFHPLILDGIIYIVSRFGQVASYNILNGEFNFDRLSGDALLVQNACSKRYWKVFVLNEEPMILYYDPDGTKNVSGSGPGPGPQCIKRYDRSRKVWIPATTLMGYTLFFGQKIYNVSLINTKGRRNNEVLSNKIFHFVDGGCHVYSLENGKLVQFGGGELLEYKYNYDGIPADRSFTLAYWLTTPRIPSSDNQGDSVRERCGDGQNCGGGQGCEQ